MTLGVGARGPLRFRHFIGILREDGNCGGITGPEAGKHGVSLGANGVHWRVGKAQGSQWESTEAPTGLSTRMGQPGPGCTFFCDRYVRNRQSVTFTLIKDG